MGTLLPKKVTKGRRPLNLNGFQLSLVITEKGNVTEKGNAGGHSEDHTESRSRILAGTRGPSACQESGVTKATARAMLRTTRTDTGTGQNLANSDHEIITKEGNNNSEGRVIEPL